MAAKKDYPGGFRLTIKKAQELALQEFGTDKGLKHEKCAPQGYFGMHIGNMEILIHPDTYGYGCVEIEVRMKVGLGTIRQFHDPETLQEDFAAEEQHFRKGYMEMIDTVKEELSKEEIEHD